MVTVTLQPSGRGPKYPPWPLTRLTLCAVPSTSTTAGAGAVDALTVELAVTVDVVVGLGVSVGEGVVEGDDPCERVPVPVLEGEYVGEGVRVGDGVGVGAMHDSSVAEPAAPAVPAPEPPPANVVAPVL